MTSFRNFAHIAE